MIREEVEADHAAVASVVEAAFGSPAEARLVADLRASAAYRPELALVAEEGGAVVGHVMVTTVALDDGGPPRPIACLSPLAVAPASQGRGVGSALVRAVLEGAEAAGEPLVVLQGDPRYYGRLGFEASAPLGITMELPDWAPSEAAQVARLSAYDPSLRGRVVLPPAFDAVT